MKMFLELPRKVTYGHGDKKKRLAKGRKCELVDLVTLVVADFVINVCPGEIRVFRNEKGDKTLFLWLGDWTLMLRGCTFIVATLSINGELALLPLTEVEHQESGMQPDWVASLLGTINAHAQKNRIEMLDQVA